MPDQETVVAEEVVEDAQNEAAVSEAPPSVVEVREDVTAVEAIEVTKAQAGFEMAQQRLNEALGKIAESILKEAEEEGVAMRFHQFDFETAQMVYQKQVESTPEEE